MAIHNKLVRDHAIASIENRNGACTYSRLIEDEEFDRELKIKLHEEVQKFSETNNTGELTDILEVVFALAKMQGVSEEDLMASRLKKLEERGGFERRLFLQELTE